MNPINARADRVRRALGIALVYGEIHPWTPVGNAPGDVYFAQGVLQVDPGMRPEEYAHEIGHAVVAAVRRPRSWRRRPNYGCQTEREEREACYVGFVLLSGPDGLPVAERVGLLSEYGFVKRNGDAMDWSALVALGVSWLDRAGLAEVALNDREAVTHA